MSIKQPIYHEFDLNATSGSSRVISLTHTDDAHVDTIELCVKQQGAPVDITGATVIARMVLHSTTDVLLNDSVPCTINDAGNILIPFDNAAVQTRKGIVKIEVNITRTPDILTLQFPLWVEINGSILDGATIDPHSEGTIPELLEEVKEELERVKDFATAEDVFEILDSALEGNPSVAPTLLIDNTVDQQFNPDGHWIMYYIDSDDLRHNIFDFSNLPSGTSDYTNLENKPQINSHTLSGNKSSDDLGLQKKLTAGTNITIADDGTISASGGVTNYNDLNNRPGVIAHLSGDSITSRPFFGTFSVSEDLPSNVLGAPPLVMWVPQKYGTYTHYVRIGLNREVVFTSWPGVWHSGGINTTQKRPFFASAVNVSNLPDFVHAKQNSEIGFINISGQGSNTQLKMLFWVDDNDTSHYALRVLNLPWSEIKEGSQLVSGVVNQNGTITFTDSNGNTFTTSGSRLVTSGNEQISMGYDNGGFYFLFDDGQEAV